MSVLVVKIKNEGILETVKKILKVFSKDVAIVDDEEIRDLKFSKLLEEGRKAGILSAEESKKELRKRGVVI